METSNNKQIITDEETLSLCDITRHGKVNLSDVSKLFKLIFGTRCFWLQEQETLNSFPLFIVISDTLASIFKVLISEEEKVWLSEYLPFGESGIIFEKILTPNPNR